MIDIIRLLRKYVLIPTGVLLADLDDEWSHDLYTTTQSHRDQFAFVSSMPVGRTEGVLAHLGFRRNILSAWSVSPFGQPERGSWAWRGHPPKPWGNRNGWEHDPLAPGQLHIVLYRVDDSRCAVFAHWEWSWVTNPVDHYTKDGAPRTASKPDGSNMVVDLVRSRLGNNISDRFIASRRITDIYER